jgi:uncharacterized damage-inducible protein DinB
VSVYTNPASSTAEETSAYVAALLELLGDRDPTEVLNGTVASISARIGGLSRAELKRPERPGKWSIGHVLQHLADSELVWGWRLRMVLAHERPVISGYDQDLWADRLGYEQADPQESLQAFAVLRNANLRLLRRATAADLKRAGIHEERGEESLEHMLRLYAGHDLLHLNQIDRIRGDRTAENL